MKNIILILLITTTTLFGQNASNMNFWSKIAIGQPLTNKINAEAEFQKRWQKDSNENSNSIPDYKLLSSFRFWIYYKLNDNITFIASPFAYFENDPIIKTENDKNKISNYENRYTCAVELTKKNTSKIKLQNRIGLEYRNFINTTPDYFRLREKLSVKLTINSKLSFIGYDEILINSNSTNGVHNFDQNRLGINLSYNPTKKIKIDLGFMKVERSQRNSIDNLLENNIVLNTYFTLPNKKLKNG